MSSRVNAFVELDLGAVNQMVLEWRLLEFRAVTVVVSGWGQICSTRAKQF